MSRLSDLIENHTDDNELRKPFVISSEQKDDFEQRVRNFKMQVSKSSYTEEELFSFRRFIADFTQTPLEDLDKDHINQYLKEHQILYTFQVNSKGRTDEIERKAGVLIASLRTASGLIYRELKGSDEILQAKSINCKLDIPKFYQNDINGIDCLLKGYSTQENKTDNSVMLKVAYKLAYYEIYDPRFNKACPKVIEKADKQRAWDNMSIPQRAQYLWGLLCEVIKNTCCKIYESIKGKDNIHVEAYQNPSKLPSTPSLETDFPDNTNERTPLHLTMDKKQS